MKIKTYIAGPITGDPDYKQKFKKAEEEVRSSGVAALNPAALPGGLEYEDYMHICFAMIDVSDCVYFLSGWEKSSGAKREMAYAKEKGKIIICQDDKE